MSTVQITPLKPLPPSSHAYPVDAFAQASALEAELKRTITGEVRFDRGTRALYATDGSNYRQVPIGVVIPRTREDVIATVAACRKFDAPVLSRGAGTSLAGQCTNVAVILDFSKYLNRVLELNKDAAYAIVEPGIVLDDLRRQAVAVGLTFAPDPATHSHCTLGGMIGNNSCGSHALMGGKTDDNTLELEVLLYDGTILTVGETSEAQLAQKIAAGGREGEIYAGLQRIRDRYAALVKEKFPDIPRRVSGYNLDRLAPEENFNVARALVGSESTCVVVLSAKLRLVTNPPYRTLVVCGYPDIFLASDHLPQILEHKPIAVEGFDRKLVEFMRVKSMLPNNIALLPGGDGWLYVEFGAHTEEESREQAHRFAQQIAANPLSPEIVIDARVIEPMAEQKRLWEVRESGLGATAFVPGRSPGWEGWEDHAVAPEQLGAYLRDFMDLVHSFGYETALYGHFGQGCVHNRINFDLVTEDGIRKFRAFLDRATDLVVQHGGSLSGEHGDGQARGALLERMFGSEIMQAFEEFKELWDPDWKMNPGKLVRARQPHADLRYGADFSPSEPKHTHFHFISDGNSFSHATQRCVGVGKCRKDEGGTMCPSYMATKEERHSTRGRAHALFEMLQGEVIGKKGTVDWNDHDVKETLDLCLSCKACKSECPVQVDIATYKSEFMSHFYKNNARPLNAYAFGHIDKWARMAAFAPELLNLSLKIPGVAALSKWVLNIPQERTIPEFAPYNFKSKFHAKLRTSNKDVLLWPDTFNNYFAPQAAEAAVRVLENAGFNVLVPRDHVCCGRPLYDFGFLDEAKKYMQRNLDRIGCLIDAGVPVVVLEPSCASVFRDDLKDLFPHDERAKKLSLQTYLLSEFLEQHAPDWKPTQWSVKTLLHGHCHHKALMKMTSQEAVLKRMGAEFTTLDAGCCGMAGPFGFEKDKYEVSQTLANRVLVPAVTAAATSTVVTTDGFSCKEAVGQNSARHGLHLAELLDLANHPERNLATPDELARRPLTKARKRARVKILVLCGAIVASVVAALEMAP
ncbi:FAD-binding and (Fe-S)-binding domain-containing protein [Terriglobus saanensis]|uniref:D-lactate dehydrogenase (Cytochrome) n=1 Tax=Terriglobus saanensis (strain ATCC BAA-1853 / DSM 23119 / SP1PR4) TaxID=401053 RepID=E8UX00_TERSS|nr:FAD-binding and (Fe-S)-binding domain-containing protein [Terriglobus saanensis]ADV81887.1 D-lactate dehydrogenase (cytochrome) [Terriglobus saanensis SP1PR4]